MAGRLLPGFIALATLAAFSPILRNGFVNLDDVANLVDNTAYRGFGLVQLRWMFGAFYMGHYQPLTWLSYAWDYWLWGMSPSGCHLTSLLLHALNAALFYQVNLLLLRAAAGTQPRKQGSIPLCAAASALFFALHPLRVEPVAWASARNDVLAGAFSLATIICYLKTCASPDETPWRRWWYAASLGAYAGALLSRGTAMTLPLVLIVLDRYPLRRPSRLRMEKLPFAALAAASFILEVAGRWGSLSERHFVAYPFHGRLMQACYGLAFYVWKTLAPFHLLPLYEKPYALSALLWPSLLSLAAVLAIGWAAIRWRDRCPALAAAEICYAVTLLPVLGFVTFGPQLVADRYSYFSGLALAPLFGGGLLWVMANRPSLKIAAWAIIGGVLVALSVRTYAQARIWKDSPTLWNYTLRINPATSTAHNNLGICANESGRPQEALAHYREALKIDPDHAVARYNLGNMLVQSGQTAAGVQELLRAIALAPGMAEAYNSLGLALEDTGRLAEAEGFFKQATLLAPDSSDPWNNWCNALQRQGLWLQAEGYCRQALRLKSDSPQAHYNLGNSLLAQNRIDEAIAHYRQALGLLPNVSEAHNSLGLALARKGLWPDAMAQFQQAIANDPSNAQAHSNLRQALHARGRRDAVPAR